MSNSQVPLSTYSSTQKNSWYGDVIDKRELIQCGGQVGFCNRNRTRSVPLSLWERVRVRGHHRTLVFA
ncbi:Uncharacterised protein [Serratia fonticola]|uniref:Uncharacterized protein n=1 Tax=Serratia fonticola TaxID=47917 RepID=A0A4U9WKF2_SERFO|nr:Uncharacterised protein [Serratia fonticola]